MDVTWATDFFTIPTLRFEVLYVLIIIEHGNQPKYLIHDNDPVFRSKIFQGFLVNSNIKSKPTSFRSPWQNPYVERVIGTIRQELLNHIIPLSERLLEKLLDVYINSYYNTDRTHQGIGGKTPIEKPTYIPVDIENFKIKSTPVLNGLYHTYERVA